MKKVLVLGIGGSGRAVAELYSDTVKNNGNVRFLGIDTDVESSEKVSGIKTLCLTDYSSLGNVIDTLGKETVSEWFPCDDGDGKVRFFRSMETGKGANGWRMKGLLSFEYMLSDEEKRGAFHKVLDEVAHYGDGKSCEEVEIIIVSSLCGGTGSALFLPVALYAKRYLKSKYGIIPKTKGLVSCPDVYEDCLTSENKVKAYANAYAAMREFNAVDLVSKGYNEYAERTRKIKVDFKIGSEKSKGVGVLFDSEKKEFHEKSAQPFDKLYLFESVVGVRTVKAHEQMMAKVLGLIENENEEREENVYAGISISEVVFEYDSVIDYVALKKTYDDIENEWRWLYSVAIKTLFSRENGVDASGKNYLERFAREFVRVYKTTLGTEKYSEYLALNRDKTGCDDVLPDVDLKTPEFTDDQIDQYVTDIARTVCSLFSCEALTLLDEELENCKIQPVKLFDSKRTKQDKINAFFDKIERCNAYLADFWRNGAKRYGEIADKFLAGIFAEKGNLSLNERLLSFEGKRLHPVTSLLMLSAFYLRFSDSYEKNEEGDNVFFVSNDGGYLPLNVLKRIDFSKRVLCERYSAFGVARITEILKSKNEKVDKKFLQAYNDVIFDFKTARNKINNTFINAVLMRVTEEAGKLLQKYVAAFDSLPSVLEDNKVDVKIALLNNTTNTCTRMNVGCDAEIKERVYVIYADETKDDFSFDSVSGNVFDECLQSGDFGLLFKRLSKERRNFVCKNQKIDKFSHADVLRVLHDRNLLDEDYPKKTKYNDLKQAFSLTALPLNIEMRGDDKDRKIKTQTVTLVPEKAGEFAKSILGEEKLGLQEAMDKYLFMQGVVDNTVTVSDSVAANMIFSIRKVYNFDLCAFNKVDERNTSSKYYKNYLKAQKVKEEQFTQMWNPHLSKDRFGEYLPFINPAQRDLYEKGVYKAVLYMLNKGILFVNPNASNYNAFYYNEDNKQKEVLFENSHVLLSKSENLFGFMRENATLTVEYTQKFDEELEKETSALPLNGYDSVDLPIIKEAILNSTVAEMLTGDMYAYVRSIKPIKPESVIDFIVEMSEKDDLKFEVENFVKVIAEIISFMVKYRTANNSESEKKLYSEVLGGIKDKYEKQAKQKGQRKYKERSEMFFRLFERIAKTV